MPRPVDGRVILLDGVNLWSFNKDAGPRAWFHCDSVSVYDLADLRWHEEQFFVEDPIQSQVQITTGARKLRIPIGLDRVHAYRFVVGRSELQEMSKEEMEEVARRQTGANE